MTRIGDVNPAYWLEYTNLQRVKHQLITEYLKGWFPKLGFWAGKIIYFDTHAGRGKHQQGQLGSPLVALRTLLSHSHRDQLLQRSEFRFVFIETDRENVAVLEQELDGLKPLPGRIHVKTNPGDCFEELEKLVGELEKQNQRLAPSFFFIDPYGFKVPGSLLARLMKFDHVELFVNVIWRELDMAMQQAGPLTNTLNEVFDGDRWKQVTGDFDDRANQTVSLFKEITGARWATYIRMLSDNQTTRYLLVHLTNHDAGRDLMKDCMWKVCPDGGFYVRKSDDPAQQYLILPEPDLAPLRCWVINRLKKQPTYWQDLINDLRSEIWREPHLSQVLRELRKEKVLDKDGKFVPSANPRLFLSRSE